MLQRIRELKKMNRGSKAAGFTIIEVMIVLAIAGVIMAIVFLAIPNLQKTNRNTQRKNDVGKIATLINDYIANNNGSVPTDIQFTSTAPTGTGKVILNASTEKFSILDTSSNVAKGSCGTTTVGTACTGLTAPAADTVQYFTHADCGNGTNNPTYSASARSYAIWYGIEGATTTQCVSQ